MTRLIAHVVSLSLFIHSLALAQDVQDIPTGDDIIQPLRRGEAAPFDGQLFDIDTSLRWANWLNQYKIKLEAQKKLDSALCQSDLSFQRDMDEIEIKGLNELNTDLKTRLTRSEQQRLQEQLDNNAWYSSVWFGAVLGAVGAAGLVIAGAQIF